VLRFSEPISAQSDAPALTLFPAIEGSLAWNAAGDGLTFTPTAGFTPGQAYSAYLHTGLRGPRGQGLESERLDFSVLSAPKVLSHSPGASQITDRRPVIQVYFDRPMRAGLVGEFERLLRPGAHLFIGHSETLNGIDTDLRSERPSVYRLLREVR